MNTGLDPFLDGAGGTPFFVTPTLHQRIELVRHLLNFGRQIIVLTGPSGSGKSSLLEQITEPSEENWRVLRFAAGPTLNRTALLHRIVDDLDLDAEGDEQALLEAIRAAAADADRRGDTIVLAIDDADALPADCIGCLANLAHGVDETAELKLILTVDPQTSSVIDRLQGEAVRQKLVHVVEVPRLTDEQTAEMLLHRWRAVYGDVDFPIDALGLSQICEQAVGLPGKAIVLARQVQIMADVPAREKADPALRYVSAGIAALVLFVIFAFFNAERPEPEPTEIDLALPDTKAGDTAPPIPAAERTHKPRIDVIAAPQLSQSPLSISPQAGIDGPAGASQRPIAAQPERAPVPATTGAPIPGPGPGPASPLPLPEIERPTAVPAPVAAPESKPDAEPDRAAVKAGPAVAGEPAAPPPVPAGKTSAAAPIPAKPVPAQAYSLKWLKTQPASGYVLQLFGVRDRAAAASFIQQRKIDRESTIIATQHQGAPWYVVIYGYYADRPAALAAIPRLPPALGDTSPWARPVSSLQ